ncbi:I-kappa-B-interacting Ras-like protein 2 [Intoshia linei]|uniref:I-kappa-B-interacting Ras-like protein 2 n=1 Tax=Intoshia linei TaxID=1819745 RepID=A0A177AZN3_9BILA|nr:I-kappa-B-interacting Ras-like protein 2 [Intoshia linei]
MLDNLTKPIRVTVAGAKRVGKTSILTVLAYGIETFSEDYHPTIEDIFYIKNENILFYDLAGASEEATIPKHYYNNADAFLLIYDVTDQLSFNIMEKLKHRIDKVRDKVPIVCLGNKSDQPHRQLTFDQVNSWAETENLRLFEVSATKRISLRDPIKFLLKNINIGVKSIFSRSKRL